MIKNTMDKILERLEKMKRINGTDSTWNKRIIMFLCIIFLVCGCERILRKENTEDRISGGGQRVYYKCRRLYGYTGLF